ncbi:ABCA3 [Symbiodinium sp. CCMP2592]|nr:ABCA3 [Symbiodinium sp. CCMP2592]
MLTGAVLPSAGSAFLGGFDIVQDQRKVRRLLGFCPQHDALLDRLTVGIVSSGRAVSTMCLLTLWCRYATNECVRVCVCICYVYAGVGGYAYTCVCAYVCKFHSGHTRGLQRSQVPRLR